MTYQQTLALDDRGLGTSATEIQTTEHLDAAQPQQTISHAVAGFVRLGRQVEGFGWVIALVLNTITGGWLGFGLWAAMFILAIALETAAQPVD